MTHRVRRESRRPRPSPQRRRSNGLGRLRRMPLNGCSAGFETSGDALCLPKPLGGAHAFEIGVRAEQHRIPAGARQIGGEVGGGTVVARRPQTPAKEESLSYATEK